MSHIKPKIVIFDWDNTLIDTSIALKKSFDDTIIALGIDLKSLEFSESQRHLSAKDIFTIICKEKAEYACELYLDFYLKHRESSLKPILNAEDTLTKLLNENIIMAVVSNKRGKILREEVELLGWGGYFKSILGAGDLEKDKPDALVVTKTLHNIGNIQFSSKKQIWLVGDSKVDIECAKNAGIVSILLGDEESNIDANYKVKNHTQLQDLINVS